MGKLKIIFVGLSLKVGGIERSLVEQLNSLDTNKIDVTLLLFNKSGPYLLDVNPNITIIELNRLFRIFAMTKDEAKKRGLASYILRSIFALYVKFFGSRYLYSALFKFVRNIGNYDLAISFFHDGSVNSLYYGCNQFTLEKIIARKKIAWIHSDYVSSKLSNQITDSFYKRFDYVVNVSSIMKKKFDTLNIIPKNRSLVVYNRYDKNRVLHKAHNSKIQLDKRFSIITVGRLEKEKGTDQLLNIAKKLRERGVSFQWHFLGTGVLLDWSRNFIKSNNLQDCVYLDGQVDNPYPNIKYSNLYVSGSLSETFGFSIIEALLLGVPVVAYRYDAIVEVLNDSNGHVVNSFEEMLEVLNSLINNDYCYQEIQRKSKLLYDYNSINERQFNEILNKCYE